MSIERFVIEKLEGANRNAVEGVTLAPDVAYNVYPIRSGGFNALGGPNESWLGSNDSPVSLEDGDGVLLEDGGALLTEWEPSPDFGLKTLLAYDESSITLLDGPTLWANNTLFELTGDEFVDESALALAPRAGVLAPWVRTSAGFEGGAWYKANDGSFTRGYGTPTATITNTLVGTGSVDIAARDYLWVVEAPTDNGLVVWGVGGAAFTPDTGTTTVLVTMDTVYSNNTVIRFYQRPATEQYYERFDTRVSNGTTAIVGEFLDSSGTYDPTEDVLINFAGGRVEAHNGRMWGRAGTPALVAFESDSTLNVTNAYMLVSGSSFSTERQRGALTIPQMVLRAANDAVEVDAQRFYARRTSSSQNIIMELFSNRKVTSLSEELFGFLRWAPGLDLPTFEVYYAISSGEKVNLMSVVLNSDSLRLGTALNSEVLVEDIQFEFRITSVTQVNVTGRHIAESSFVVTAASPTITLSGTATSGAFTVSPVSRIITAEWGAGATLRAVTRKLFGGGDILTAFPAFGTVSDYEDYLVDGADTSWLAVESLDAEVFDFWTASIGMNLSTVRYCTSVYVKGSLAAGSLLVRWYRSNVQIGTAFITRTQLAAGVTVTVNDLCDRFDVFAEDAAISPDGRPTKIDTPDFKVYQLVPAGSTVTSWAAWGDYSTADEATTFALGRAPSAHVSGTTGNRELRVNTITAFAGAVVTALGSIDDYVAGLTWTSSSAVGETWTTNSEANMVVLTEVLPANSADPIARPDLTLVYSDTGSVNRGKGTNFLPLSPLSSSRITALASTPAGLLVFMENETFLVRGDPGTKDLSVQRLSGTLGCDPNVIPARLGSVVMPIYKGEVFAVNLGGGDVDFGGSLVNVSQPVWLPNDSFVQVVGENLRSHIVAITQGGRAYRLDTQSQQWVNDPFDETVDLRFLIPAGNDPVFGVKYNVGGYLSVVDSSVLADVRVEWEDIDLGDKNLMKLWRRVEVFTEPNVVSVPLLTYSVRGVESTVLGIEQGRGRWVFTFGRGVVGPTASLRLRFPDSGEDFVLEPPVVIEFVSRYRER